MTIKYRDIDPMKLQTNLQLDAAERAEVLAEFTRFNSLLAEPAALPICIQAYTWEDVEREWKKRQLQAAEQDRDILFGDLVDSIQKWGIAVSFIPRKTRMLVRAARTVQALSK